MLKRFLTVALASTGILLHADSVVVFNEVMYHPPTNETELEWVELHNQMAVDVDLTGWSIHKGIGFDFPRGTVIPGGGYLVVAASVTNSAWRGMTNVLGPYTGRLSNGGDSIELRNNSGRVMDELDYGVAGDWPVAADGAGPSLAKIDEESATAPAANWAASAQMGGTPGTANRLRINGTNIPPRVTLAFNELSAVTNAEFWIEIVNYGTQPVALTDYVLARFGTTNREYVIPAQAIPAQGHLVLDRATVAFGADPGDQVILYMPGKTNVADAVIAKSFPRARWPEATGPWLHPTQLTPGTTNVVALRDELVINEIMYQPRPFPATAAVYETNALLTITNGWRYEATGTDLGTAWSAAAYDDRLWPTGRAVFYTNVTTLPAPKGTTLALSNAAQQGITAYYFRTQFVFTNSPVGVQLVLNPIVDDGAVFYLNGVEVYRLGMNTGVVTYATLATNNVGSAAFSGPITLPGENLVTGTNILAVEVHQYLPPPGSRDIAFGAEVLAARLVSPALPERDSPESWIELYNRSGHAVDLTGWSLSDGIKFSFTNGTTIPAGGYLVVAKNVGYVQTNFPAAIVVGPFTNKLSHSSDHIVLEDSNGNPANEVRYFDGKPWPTYAAGLGSSLELRDPRADNTRPEAWAASDQSSGTGWQTYSYRGLAAAEPAASPTQWNEFVMGLLGEGELLLDDLSVIESPGGTRRQLVQNGSFENGLSAWRMLGNHRASQVIVDPGNAANHVLRLVATGDTEHMHNHCETTLTNNTAVVNGNEYEISFRAKWVAGCPKLNTRLYFNRLARTTSIAVPQAHGTPGAKNTRYATNIGPTFVAMSHNPAVPTASQATTISVTASDPDGVATASLIYSVNGAAWQTNAMTLTPSSTGLVLKATIPAQAAASLVQFYVRSIDGAGVAATYPAGGANSRAMYKVSDGTALMPRLHTMRLLMTAADAAFLHAATNAMSNDDMACTVIADEREIFYDAALHLQSSERGRTVSSRVGFSVNLPADHLLRGVHDGFTADRSGGYSGKGGKHDELLLKHAVNRAGGLPGMYDDLAQVFAPRSSEDGTAILILAKYGSVFLDSQYKNGNDGELYKLELIYYPTTTSTGDPQAPKLPQPDGVLGADIRDLGIDAEAYRWTFLKENHVSRDHYQPMMTLAQTMSLTGTNFSSRIGQVMDVDEWMRAVAFLSLIGGDDIYTYNNEHNLIIYIRPEDQKAMAFLWDMDFSFVAATTKAFPGSGSATTYKLITTIPDNYRRYYNHLYDLSSITGDTAYMTQWANRFAPMVGQNWSGAVDYLVQRAAFVRSTMPLTNAFTIANNGGTNFAVSTNSIVITGTAPMMVRDIEINGIRYPITWTSLTTWTTTVPLPGYTNLLTVKGVDNAGAYVTNATSSITVTNRAAPALLPVVINEWMADNGAPGGFPDPVDSQFQDWFELFNPNDAPVDLSGYFLTDTLALPTKWMIPTNTIMAPRGFLLVWADEDGAQNSSGNGDLHANFKLSNGGEALGLYSPNGTPQHTFTFGPQYQNVSQGLYPDGNTNGVYFMTNWTPRASNRLGAPPQPVLTAALGVDGTNFVFSLEAIPGRAYRVDYKAQLDDPIWTPLSTNRVAGSTLVIADGAVAARRFYRVVVLE